MPQAFGEASRVETIELGPSGGRFSMEMPDGWQQGRGAFGGLVLGALTRASLAAGEAAGALPQLRTLTGSLCAPALPGPHEIEVELLRQGSRLSFARATLRSQDKGGVVATATCTLGGQRPGETSTFLPEAPALPSWESVNVLPMGAPMGPVFAQHYEYRSTGPFPFSGGEEARAEGWIRTREDPGTLDAAAIIGMLDAYWPAEFATVQRFRPMATISFTAELFVDPAELEGDAPFAYRAVTHAAQAGFALELRELWREGRIVAMNQQTFVALG